jgi:hypothetical protein
MFPTNILQNFEAGNEFPTNIRLGKICTWGTDQDNDYQLDDCSSVSRRSGEFFLHCPVQTRSGALPASYSVGARDRV